MKRRCQLLTNSGQQIRETLQTWHTYETAKTHTRTRNHSITLKNRTDMPTHIYNPSNTRLTPASHSHAFLSCNYTTVLPPFLCPVLSSNSASSAFTGKFYQHTAIITAQRFIVCINGIAASLYWHMVSVLLTPQSCECHQERIPFSAVEEVEGKKKQIKKS